MLPKVNYCFKGRVSNVSACGFYVNGQYFDVPKCAMHLGLSIDFGHISSQLKNILF